MGDMHAFGGACQRLSGLHSGHSEQRDGERRQHDETGAHCEARLHPLMPSDGTRGRRHRT
jgi:hypothetical protein